MIKKKEENKTDIEKLLTMSKIKGITIHDFISKKMWKKLETKYGKTFFPMIAIALDEKKKFIFLFHESMDAIDKKEVFILNQVNFKEKDIKELIEFVKNQKKGD